MLAQVCKGKGNPLTYVFHRLLTIDSSDSHERDTCQPLGASTADLFLIPAYFFKQVYEEKRISWKKNGVAVPVECGTLLFASVWRT